MSTADWIATLVFALIFLAPGALYRILPPSTGPSSDLPWETTAQLEELEDEYVKGMKMEVWELEETAGRILAGERVYIVGLETEARWL